MSEVKCWCTWNYTKEAREAKYGTMGFDEFLVLPKCPLNGTSLCAACGSEL